MRVLFVWLVVCLLSLSVITNVSNAQIPTCARKDGKSACCSHVTNPITGDQTWSLWNEEWTQTISWSEEDSLLKVTRFRHWLDDEHTEYIDWIGSTGTWHEYEISCRRSNGDLDTLSGPTNVDDLDLKDSDVTASTQDGYVDLEIDLEREDDFELRLFYRCWTDGALETWSEVINVGLDTMYVEHLASFRRNLNRQTMMPDGTNWYVYFLFNGVTPPILHQRSLGMGGEITPEAAWFNLIERAQDIPEDGLGGGLIMPSIAHGQPFSTGFRQYSPEESLSVRILKKYGNIFYTPETPLPASSPYSSFEAIHVYLSFNDGSIYDMSHKSHAFIRGHYQPELPDTFPFVQYNPYFGYDTDFNYDSLAAEADSAAEIGVEAFVVDAAWWEGSVKQEPQITEFEQYLFGTGYWFGDSCKFDPSQGESFKDFCDYVTNEKGMRMGVWVFPSGVDTVFANQANPRCWGPNPPSGDPCFYDSTIELSCKAWLDNYLVEYLPPESGDGPTCASLFAESDCPVIEADCRRENPFFNLCGGFDEANNWMTTMMEHIVSDYTVRYLKIDGPTYYCANHSGHVHRRLESSLYRFQSPWDGLYQIMDDLRAEYSDLVIEGGWPMGHLEFSEDPLDPSSVRNVKTRYGLESIRWFVPSTYTGNYLVWPIWPAPTGNSDEEHFINTVRSHMLGQFCISAKIASWPDTFRMVVEDHIDFYKQQRRFWRGESRTIISLHAECGGDEMNPCADSWDAVEYIDPGTKEALILVFRNDVDSESRNLPIYGLYPDSNYVILAWKQSEGDTLCGSDLMDEGYTITLPKRYSSEILRIFNTHDVCN